MHKPTRNAIRRLEHIIAKLEAWENARDAGQRLDQDDAYLAAEAKNALMRLLDKMEAEQ